MGRNEGGPLLERGSTKRLLEPPVSLHSLAEPRERAAA